MSLKLCSQIHSQNRHLSLLWRISSALAKGQLRELHLKGAVFDMGPADSSLGHRIKKDSLFLTNNFWVILGLTYNAIVGALSDLAFP